MHRPLPLRAPCVRDVELASEGDKDARKRVWVQRSRVKKRLRDIALFDEREAAGR